MKKLELNQMECLEGGNSAETTIILCYTGPFACLAAATGIGCAIGIYVTR